MVARQYYKGQAAATGPGERAHEDFIASNRFGRHSAQLVLVYCM